MSCTECHKYAFGAEVVGAFLQRTLGVQGASLFPRGQAGRPGEVEIGRETHRRALWGHVRRIPAPLLLWWRKSSVRGRWKQSLIRGWAPLWISEWLKQQQVGIDGLHHNRHKWVIGSRVAQLPVWGPVLFSLFINNLELGLECRTRCTFFGPIQHSSSYIHMKMVEPSFSQCFKGKAS